jgi:hypothetical protein
MEFLIPELNPYDWKPIFTGTHSRNPTVTDVKFISATRLVAANRQAAKLYLIEKGDTGFKILYTLDTVFDGISYHTDLFDIVNNTIYATNYTNTACVYKIIDTTIVFQKTLKLHAENKYHGVQAHNNKVFFTPAIGISKIAIYTPETETLMHVLPERIGTNRIKDICFINNYQVILLLTTDTPCEYPKEYDGFIALYTFSSTGFKYHMKTVFKNTHLDSVIGKNNKFYATAHSSEKNGILLVCEIKDNIIQLLETKSVHGFPHGITIYDKTLAYTSYNTSGIHFLTI